MTLDKDPIEYFFHLFANHENKKCVTYANFYNLFKYYRYFDDMNRDATTRTGVVYPE